MLHRLALEPVLSDPASDVNIIDTIDIDLLVKSYELIAHVLWVCGCVDHAQVFPDLDERFIAWDLEGNNVVALPVAVLAVLGLLVVVAADRSVLPWPRGTVILRHLVVLSERLHCRLWARLELVSRNVLDNAVHVLLWNSDP
ncbi:hypothetical protein EXIGLDRAFT_441178 [Exidia glandulosa HHB12029]|uniref:Uncharacterized protein n=1 Tax=Exidia glandulosa HHB12029 TaxID=1314781 RepID=A0A165B6S7_EXIGL|nr:hypothetical protein EXIGLDRAFT_441178 [Exidia glandulosa HHB12029]